jgi:ATP-dependent DNA helicase RecQ
MFATQKTKVEACDQVVKLLEVVRDTKHLYKSKEVVLRLLDVSMRGHKAHRTDTQSFFGCGSEFDENIGWHLEAGSCSWILSKDIETYGIVKLPKKDGFYQE